MPRADGNKLGLPIVIWQLNTVYGLERERKLMTTMYINFNQTTATIVARTWDNTPYALDFNCDGHFYNTLFKLVMKYHGDYYIIGKAVCDYGNFGGISHEERKAFRQLVRIATGHHHFHHVGVLEYSDVGEATFNLVKQVEKYIGTKYGKKHVYSF